MATAAVHGAADFAMDTAGDLSVSARNMARDTSHRVQNTITRAIDEAEPEDMVQIHTSIEGENPDSGTEQTDMSQRPEGSNDHRHPVQQLWEDKHTVKEPTRWGVAMHDVSFSGLGGGMFLIMLIASVLLMGSFVSVGWVAEPLDGEDPMWINKGLWEECTCTRNKHEHQEGYFTTTQVLVTMGFVVSWFAMLCITLYMCLCMNIIKKTYLLFGLMAASALTVVLYFIALVVFAAGENMRLGWSYGLSLVGTFLCGVAGALAAIQLRRSVHV